MQALEFETIIGHDHEIHLKLPIDAREGRARVIVLYDERAGEPVCGNLDEFLATLPLNTAGRSRSDIAEQVQEERENWGNAP
ncbi:hypothetical protein ABZN20_10455 [Methylococcus sp. ANG]|uniref:hypothetical protein n=1 Tax=Methylococcus sp. ANG TaxID=3231903 RepID=UPI0034575566